ncbi:hypothetical protein F5Y14DRAFT_204004 [Nemania sp. NC0429]|nr:hypothetical protein F5Y14DRAFT_204004 [Nemania sp. NC0429]
MLSQRLVGWLVSFLLLVFPSLPVVTATGQSGAYERIGPIYQAYRIAVEVWGADQKKILPALADMEGTHPKGGANFREMENFLDSEDFDEDFYKDEGIDINDPEPHKTAIHLYYSTNLGLLPLEKIFAGTSAGWPYTIEQIRTVLRDAHDEMEKKGKLDDIKPYRERLEACHVEISRFRQSEMEGGNNGKKGASKDIKAKWPAAKVVVSTTEWEHDTTAKLYAVDVGATVAGSPEGTFKIEEVEAWVKGYGSNEGDSNVSKNHYKVLEAHRATMSMERGLLANPSCK